MEYQILPMGEVWASGMFSVPTQIAEKHLRFASEYQLKALLLILSRNGRAGAKEIAGALGITENDVNDLLEYWVEEGVLLRDGAAPPPAIKTESVAPPKKTAKKEERIPVPVLSPHDVTEAMTINPALAELAQEVAKMFGNPSTSHIENEMIVNMVNHYGLPAEVVLTLFQYYKNEKDGGRAIGNAYLLKMAENWSEEGITTLAAADEKLRDLANSDRLWNDIVLLSGIRHRSPTVKQREMVKAWSDDFSLDMIALACDTMKENTDKPTLKYVDTVLKNWLKKGLRTPDDVRADNEKHAQKKKSSGRIESAPSFDIEAIEKKTLLDDNYDI